MTTTQLLTRPTTTPASVPVKGTWLSSFRAELRRRRADQGALAQAITSYPATRSAFVLPPSAVLSSTPTTTR